LGLQGHRPDDVARLVEPGSAPRFRKQGDAVREPAVWHEGPIGPMRGDVAIEPIRRRAVVRKPSGDRDVYFEVVVRWGPTDDGRPVPGLTGLPSHNVVDVAAVDDYDAAQQLARAAADALRDPPSWLRPPVELFRLARDRGIPLVRQLLT
jgi:hypothetical protein